MSLARLEASAAPSRPLASKGVETCGLRLRVERDLAAFAAWWPRLGDKGRAHCHAFQCADFLEVWLDTVGRARRTQAYFVGVFTPQGAPLMLLALGIERRFGLRTLTFLDGIVSDYNMPVLFAPAGDIEPARVRALWAEILARLPRFDVTSLRNMPAEVDGIPNPLLHLGAVRSPESGHAMTLGGSREALEARLPRRHRKPERVFAKLGPRFERGADRGRASAIVEVVLAMKARRFVDTKVAGFEAYPGMRVFYEEATRRLSLVDAAQVHALTVEGEIVAAHWGLRFDDRLYFLVTGFNDAWGRHAPGQLLLRELIRDAHAKGVSCFDFGIGDEDYKAQYCDIEIPLHTIQSAATVRGRLSLLAAKAEAWARASALYAKLRRFKWALRDASRKRAAASLDLSKA